MQIHATVVDSYLKKIGDQAIVSHLENRGFWVLVNGNNDLKNKQENDLTQVGYIAKKASISGQR